MLTFDMIRRIYDDKAPVKTPRLKVDSVPFSVTDKISERRLEAPVTSDQDYIFEKHAPVLEDEYYFHQASDRRRLSFSSDEFNTYENESVTEMSDFYNYEYESETEMYALDYETETGTTEYYPKLNPNFKLGDLNWTLQDDMQDLSQNDDVEKEEIEVNVGVRTIQCIAAIVSLIALVYGIVTWTMLPKSRTFNNYVYINSIFTLTLVLWLPYLAVERSMSEIVMYCVLFFEFGFLCWLAIASVLMYRDIVLVFVKEIPRKTLKCNIFAWGVPLSGLTVLLSTGNHYFYVCYSVILWSVLVVQVFFYLRVLYCLFSESQDNTAGTPCRNIQIATFTFFMGGIPVVLDIAISQRPIAMALDIMDPMNIVIQIFLLFPLMVYNVFFIIRKSNRCLWREWQEKRKAVNLFNV